MATEKRLIDANKPIAETESIINFRLCHHMPTEDYESFLNYLKKQPTVDAVPVAHGRWVWNKYGWWQCSECGCSPADWEPDSKNEYGLPPYCHSCGAKMDLEVKDDT